MRRLPVIQQASGEDHAAAERPPWQWCLIGAGLAATIWVPLAVIAAPLGANLAARFLHVRAADVASGAAVVSPDRAALLAMFGAAPLLVCYGVATAIAGALVGRFGGRARQREAAVSGVLAAFLVTCVAALGGSGLSTLGILLALSALAVVGASFGFLGAAFGVRRRAVLDSPR
jgi:MFS family permease